jgi:hypothetical protein
MHPSDDASTLPALSFTFDDLATAASWHRRFRSIAVPLRISAGHANYEEMLEVGEPWPSPRHDGARWLVWRDAAGVWLDDTADSQRHRARNLGGALRLIWKTIAAERRDAIEAIPETLALPDLLASVLATWEQRGASPG